MSNNSTTKSPQDEREKKRAALRKRLIENGIRRLDQGEALRRFAAADRDYQRLTKQGKTKEAEEALRIGSFYALEGGTNNSFLRKLKGLDPTSAAEKQDLEGQMIVNQAPFELPTKIKVDGKDYSSFADYKKAKNEAAAEKKRQMKIDEAKRVLEKYKGATSKSLETQIAESKKNLATYTAGGSYQTRFEDAFRNFLHGRRLTAAQQTAALRKEAAGAPDGAALPGGASNNLVTYDAYGRPVDPGILNLSQYYGKLSKEAISALALDHAKRKAAYRTAQSQYNKENPHLAGRDVASMLRTEFRESAAGQAVRQDYLRDKEAARTIQKNIADQTTALNAYNTLTSAGYQYDKDKGWQLPSSTVGAAPQDDEKSKGVS